MELEKRVLAVDDDVTMQGILRDILLYQGYDVQIAANGQEALDLHREHSFPVILTDLEMPVMKGHEMIKKIREYDANTVIIVLTVHRDPDNIIKIMKMDVYDYLLKPVEAGDLQLKVKRAFEAYELRMMKQVMEKERQQKLLDQLEWFRYTENLTKRNFHRFDKTLFESLQINFTKGAGIGTLLTILKLISETAKPENDRYMIDRDLFDVVKENARIAENVINRFSSIIKIINDDMPMERISLAGLYSLVEVLVKKQEENASLKGQTILLNEPQKTWSSIAASINADQLMTTLQELLINAMKFSKPSSTILVIIEALEKYVEVSVVNSPANQVEGVTGIPPEYERLVFEPFYRMSRDITGDYESLDYGLGLSLVEIVMQKHDGTVSAGNVRDNSLQRSRVEDRVKVTLQLPRVVE